jgi:8-oxo-dGTP pyrophosphatase MutT (NUDIX family)
MITFDRDNCRFTYRVAGVAIHDGMVLLHRDIYEEFWVLPGGRCEMGEQSSQGLRREIREELGVDVEIRRPLWIVENFFDYGGMACHELGIYHLMEFPAGSPLFDRGVEFSGYEGEHELVYRWHRLDALDRIVIYPEFLREKLASLPEGIEHVVQFNQT